MKRYLILTLILFVFIASPAYAVGTLSCSVTTASSCTGTANVVVYRMSASANAHAELPSQVNGNYDSNVVCCTGVTGLSNACTAPYAVVLRLSGVTNAHAEEGGQSNSNYNGKDACLSVPAGGTISVGYVAGTAGITGTTCVDGGYTTTLGSISGLTNNHVGGPASYAIKICGTASYAPISGVLVSSVFDTTATSSSVGYNSIMWKGSLGGLGLNEGKVRFQFGASPVYTGPWNYYGGTSCGPLDWFDPLGPNNPIELKEGPGCIGAWNNKRYFRYKVQICSHDCISAGTNSPTVDDIIVNWSP